jgi:hypothetical protein
MRATLKGLLDTWSAVTHYAQVSSCGHINLPTVEIQKIPLPANLVTPQLQPAYFKFDTSTPAKLTGMSNLVSTELIRILLTALQSNFSIAVGRRSSSQGPPQGKRVPEELNTLFASDQVLSSNSYRICRQRATLSRICHSRVGWPPRKILTL